MRGTRKRNAFSSEEKAALEANQFTQSVTTTKISYTDEFKTIFLEKYQAGEHVKDIFEYMGYDTNILGEGRIYNFSHVLSKNAKFNSGEAPKSTNSSKINNATVASMQAEITYLKQQIDFLKKITALDNKGKQKP